MPLHTLVARFAPRTAREDSAAPEPAADDAEGRGWYLSSYDLRRGLEVTELHDVAVPDPAPRRPDAAAQA
jgi:hypothetical protein